MANIVPKVVFGIFLLTLSSANVDFLDRELRWSTYNTKETFSISKRIELEEKKEFAAIALNPKHKTFIIHIASLSSTPLNIYPSRRPQISGLIVEETSIKVFNKYIDFADMFFSDLASKLLKHTEINDNAIELVDNQQLPYKPIYSLEPVELEILKAYIETNLANEFIRLLSYLRVLPSYLTKNQTDFSSYALTIEASITSQSRTSICCHWLGSH